MTSPEIVETLARVTVRGAASCRNLTVLGLFDPAAGPAGWLTLDEALAAGSARVTEISEGGAVPELRLVNDGERPVLLLDGEELVGAKQNRILSLTILAPARSEIVIPVACVEQGRWSWRSRGFASADRAIFAKLRRRKVEAVSRRMAAGAGRAADQAEVWSEVAAKARRMGAYSDTGAAAAIYERHEADLAEFVAGLRPAPGQVGALFLVNGRIAGLELFAAPDLYARLSAKLVRSYALDALDDQAAPAGRWEDAAAGHAARHFLAAVQAAPARRHKAVGLGVDLRLDDDDLVGAALIAEGRVAHLSAFAKGYV